AIFGSVLPPLIKESRQFVERVPDIVKNFERSLDKLANDPPPLLRGIFKKITSGDSGSPPAPQTNAFGAELTVTNAAGVTVPATNAPSLFEGSFNEKALESAQKWISAEFPDIGKW